MNEKFRAIFSIRCRHSYYTPNTFSVLTASYTILGFCFYTEYINNLLHGWDDEATRERASTTWLIRDDGAFPPQYNKSGMPVVHWFVLVILLCVGYSQKSNGLSSYINSHLLFIGLRQSFLFFKGPIINKEKESRSNMQNQLTGISPDRGFCDGIWRSHLFTIETHIG